MGLARLFTVTMYSLTEVVSGIIRCTNLEHIPPCLFELFLFRFDSQLAPYRPPVVPTVKVLGWLVE